jgi:hypothetical protein
LRLQLPRCAARTRRLNLLQSNSVGFAKERSTHPAVTGGRARKSPARFPARAHLVSFNFLNSPIQDSCQERAVGMLAAIVVLRATSRA